MKRKLMQFGSRGIGVGLTRQEGSTIGAAPGVLYTATVVTGRVVLRIVAPGTAEPLLRVGSRGLAATRDRSISGGVYLVLPPTILATMGWQRGTSVEVTLAHGSIEVAA